MKIELRVGVWRRWFAWRPVVCDNGDTVVWLQHVMRRALRRGRFAVFLNPCDWDYATLERFADMMLSNEREIDSAFEKFPNTPYTASIPKTTTATP